MRRHALRRLDIERQCASFGERLAPLQGGRPASANLKLTRFLRPVRAPCKALQKHLFRAPRARRPPAPLPPSRQVRAPVLILHGPPKCYGAGVAPSRERGSKPAPTGGWIKSRKSLPHGSADRNGTSGGKVIEAEVAPSRERGSKRCNRRLQHGHDHVAPSRERGSKRSTIRRCAGGWRSLPHGSADRNPTPRWRPTSPACRSLTGARIETIPRDATASNSTVAPSRERGSKLRHQLLDVYQHEVAPSRERGSKHAACRCRALRREVAPSRERGSKLGPVQARQVRGRSLPHGSADRNKDPHDAAREQEVAPSRERGSKHDNGRGHCALSSRSLTGARIETTANKAIQVANAVAPSRERGSKPAGEHPERFHQSRSLTGARIETRGWTTTSAPFRRSLPHGSADRNVSSITRVSPGRKSLPHGSADRNYGKPKSYLIAGGRSLTGARIETASSAGAHASRSVAPSRERGSKQRMTKEDKFCSRSLPHGSADRN